MKTMKVTEQLARPVATFECGEVSQRTVFGPEGGFVKFAAGPYEIIVLGLDKIDTETMETNIVAAISEWKQDAREALFKSLRGRFCMECGLDENEFGQCHCMNDE